MTKRLIISGHSDDLVEISGNILQEEFPVTKDRWEGIITAPDGDTARVYVEYRRGGVWTVTLGIYEEGYELPKWPMTLFTDGELYNDYSTVMALDVPKGTTIRKAKKKDS